MTGRGKYIRTDEVKKRMSEGCLKRDPSTRISGENHPNYVEDKNHNCVDCGKKLRVAGTQRCLECYKTFNRGENHHLYKESERNEDGLPVTKGICDQCGGEVIQVNSDYNKVDQHFCSRECFSKWISVNKRGRNSHSYKNGNTTLNMQIRISALSRTWRKAVFERDDYTCQNCSSRSHKGHPLVIEAHHIKEFAEIVKEYNITTFEEASACEELWNISNGITLCRACHDKTKNGGPLKIKQNA